MKILFLLQLLIVSATIAFAQKKEVVLSNKFLPDTKYITTVESHTLSEMNIEASEEILAKIKANGVQLPMLTENKSSMVSTIITGAIREDKSFPATINYDKATTINVGNGKTTEEESPISGLVVKGNYNAANQFVIDTLISTKLNESLRYTLKASLENVQNQIKFPDKPMKIGDDFTQKLPMAIPIAGMEPVKITINTTYKLKDIKNKLALFDIVQTVQLDMVVEQSDVTATGSGTGTSEYDMEHKYTMKHESDLVMQMTMNMNNFKIVADTKTKSSQLVKISK
ncbi:hypothetical protein JAO76_10425 [Pontibacter sp. BT310]|uniref:Uncharacterized protein n=1 Tax=Pontibacter populi TaxID=890055 RepID=A0ABS6XD78_9BACT|nr:MULTISPECIES: hypothetical protein [Pontibacter]MBJ6118609.1 hypothetical protein [Pontibacter sp. BT310]MBR0571038.1 hypothetical protein [Microvirga sp. STS03]MBW3365463.1 hypothetical protein [Pontibacter populi]